MKRTLQLFASLVVWSVSCSTWAQSLPPNIDQIQQDISRQQQEQMRIDQERARDKQKPSGVDLKALAPTAAPPVQTGPCSKIQTVSLVGADDMYPEEREALMSRYAGQCLSAGDIQMLLEAVTRRYIDRGYITTRAYLPEQDLREGRLLILVQEGRIEKIEVRGDDDRRVNVGLALPAREGDLLNIRDLEQAVDQINSAKGNQVKLDLLPGSKPGETVVVFNNTASRPVGLQVSLDNEGTSITGRDSVSAMMTTGGVLGGNETMSLTMRSSVPHTPEKSAQSIGLGLSVPLGYNTFGVQYAQSNYSIGTPIPNRDSLLYLTGNTSTSGLTFERTLSRDQNAIHKLEVTESTVDSKNYADSALMQVNSRSSSTLGVGVNSTLNVANGLLSVFPQVAMGLNDQNNLPAGLNTQSQGLQAEFTKYTLDASFNNGFKLDQHDLSWKSQFKGQYSPDMLLVAQQILIGGSPSVRGYVNTILTGDSGYYWRNDLSLHQGFAVGNAIIKSRFYAGYDFGHVSSHTASLPQGELSGAVLGVDSQWAHSDLDLSLAHATHMPAGMARETGQIWMRLTVHD